VLVVWLKHLRIFRRLFFFTTPSTTSSGYFAFVVFILQSFFLCKLLCFHSNLPCCSIFFIAFSSSYVAIELQAFNNEFIFKCRYQVITRYISLRMPHASGICIKRASARNKNNYAAMVDLDALSFLRFISWGNDEMSSMANWISVPVDEESKSLTTTSCMKNKFGFNDTINILNSLIFTVRWLFTAQYKWISENTSKPRRCLFLLPSWHYLHIRTGLAFGD
jgi:hypothetical protein